MDDELETLIELSASTKIILFIYLVEDFVYITILNYHAKVLFTNYITVASSREIDQILESMF